MAIIQSLDVLKKRLGGLGIPNPLEELKKAALNLPTPSDVLSSIGQKASNIATIGIPKVGVASDSGVGSALAGSQNALSDYQKTLSSLLTAPKTIAPVVSPTPQTYGSYAETPSTQNQDLLYAITNALTQGQSSSDSAKDQMAQLITQLQTQQQDYLKTLQGQPSALDLYSQYREQLGLPAKEEALTGIQTQVQSTEKLLSDLETNINSRASGMATGEGLSQAQLAREQAVESRPLQKTLTELEQAAGVEQTGLTGAQTQLQQMLGLAQTEQTRQAQIAQAPMNFTSQILPTIQSMLSYQSPQEKYAQDLAIKTYGDLIGDSTSTGATAKEDKVLSTSDAKALGVPYGTTESQAAALGITPSAISPAETLQAKNVLTLVDNADKQIDKLEIAAKNLKALSWGPAAIVKGQIQKGLATAGLSPAVEQFNAIKGVLRNTIAMSLIPGGRGGAIGLRYTTPQVDEVMPSVGDHADEIEYKIAALRDIVDDYRTTAESVYGSSAMSGAGVAGNTWVSPSGKSFTL